MKRHTLRLHSGPFDEIARGDKTIELRLYDEKRRQIIVGDELVFVDRRNEHNVIRTRVDQLVRAASFHELLEDEKIANASGPNIAWLESQLAQFYSMEEQLQYGVVGIKFTVVS